MRRPRSVAVPPRSKALTLEELERVRGRGDDFDDDGFEDNESAPPRSQR
jgi:hypothetical protein